MVKRAAPSPVPRETPSTISFSLKPSSRRSHPTRFQQGFLHIVARCTRRSAAPRQNVDSNGLEHRVFQENRHKALGFSSMDDFIINFMYCYFSVMDPNDLLCMAMEMASAATLAATPMATCGRHWAGSKPRRLSCRCLRICFSRRPTAKPSGGSFPMRSSGLSQTIDGHLALFGADANAIAQLDKHLSELLATKV
jgi:homoserine O-acetyltransferase/O-succinyltransferase